MNHRYNEITGLCVYCGLDASRDAEPCMGTPTILDWNDADNCPPDEEVQP